MKPRLKNLSRKLTQVHKILLDETLREYGQREGRSISPQDAWRAAMNDPFFAWLRPVSMLIAEIDEMVAQEEEITEGLAHGVRLEVESLLDGVSTGSAFAQRYREMLQQSPDLVARHGELKSTLAELPPPADGSPILTRDQWPLPDGADSGVVN